MRSIIHHSFCSFLEGLVYSDLLDAICHVRTAYLFALKEDEMSRERLAWYHKIQTISIKFFDKYQIEERHPKRINMLISQMIEINDAIQTEVCKKMKQNNV